jgi:hypothetical protein
MTPKTGGETADIQSKDAEEQKSRNQGKLEFDTTEVNKVVDEEMAEEAQKETLNADIL